MHVQLTRRDTSARTESERQKGVIRLMRSAAEGVKRHQLTPRGWYREKRRQITILCKVFLNMYFPFRMKISINLTFLSRPDLNIEFFYLKTNYTKFALHSRLFNALFITFASYHNVNLSTLAYTDVHINASPLHHTSCLNHIQ